MATLTSTTPDDPASINLPDLPPLMDAAGWIERELDRRNKAYRQILKKRGVSIEQDRPYRVDPELEGLPEFSKELTEGEI